MGVIIYIKEIYTERQKKLITSSERHTLKSKTLKLIIIRHKLAIKHISKNLHLEGSKMNKIRWNCKRSVFKKSQKLLASRVRTSSTRLLNWMNSYWMFWIGGLSWRFSANIFHLFGKSNLLIFQMRLRSTIAYLFLNMINFDVHSGF